MTWAEQSQHVEVTWTGATWRTFPPPVVARSTEPTPTVILGGSLRDGVMRVLTHEWQSITTISTASEVPYKQCWAALQKLVREDRAEESSEEVDRRRPRSRGEVVRWYRRVTHDDL